MNKNLFNLCIAILCVGCNGSDSSLVSRAMATGKALVAPLTPGPAVEQFADADTFLDLSAQAGLAQIDVHGWFIDIGSAAQAQHTMGDWRSGWGKRGEEQGASYAEVGTRGRVYVSLDQASPLRVSLRIKAAQAMPVTLYVNEFVIESLNLAGGGKYEEVSFKVPAEKVHPGENVILFHFGKPQVINGVGFAGRVDWVRIQEGDSANDNAAPNFSFASLVGKSDVGGKEKSALRMPGASRLRFTVDVPEKAKLVFSIGAEQEQPVSARVVATTDGQTSETLWRGEAKNAWKEVALDLKAHDSPVRIDFVAEGNSSQHVAWSRPRIVVPSSPSNAGTTVPKNVIVLLIDTQRADKFHAFNPNTRVKTPTIDMLAKEGTIFESTQAPENWTKPSCASVLTGLHPQTHRQKFDDSVLPASVTMLSEQLKAQGMTTAIFSANGYVSDKFGFKQGWDYYTNYIREEKGTTAAVVFNDAAKWVEANKAKPFFTYIQTIDPHVPYDPPEEDRKLYDPNPYDGPIKPRLTPDLLEKAKRVPPAVTFTARDKEYIKGLYDGEVTYHDVQLGKFIERLKAAGVWGETLLVVTADHGEELEDHGSWGHGHSVYQELLHVPLVFHLPGRVPQGARIDSTVSSYDVPATVLDLLGKSDIPDDEGHSLVPFFDGRLPSHPLVGFSDFQDDRRVVRAGRYKYIVRGNLTATLFDLEKDPGELAPLDSHAVPIAQAYCRAVLGQFLGARDRRDWYLMNQQARSAPLKQENAIMDDATKAQLKALGYVN